MEANSSSLPLQGPSNARPRFLRLLERDPHFPRDSDGCPTASGREWLVDLRAIAAIEMTPDRGDSIDIKVHLHGRKVPLRVCEDGTDLMRKLGLEEPLATAIARLNDCRICERPLLERPGADRLCPACAHYVAMGEDGEPLHEDDDPMP